MPVVSVQCPHCARSYTVDDSLVGRKARCKHCGQSLKSRRSTTAATSRSGTPIEIQR
jgi:predicted Zn finger-like uncharacterized protein